MPGKVDCVRPGEELVAPLPWKPSAVPAPYAQSIGLIGALQKAALKVLPSPPHGAWSRLKFIGRALLYGKWVTPWLGFLDRPELRRFAELQPGIYLRVQWPYLNRSYGPAQRLELAVHHYGFILRQLSPALAAALFSGQPLALARWSVGELGLFTLKLYHVHEWGQEGEMVLTLERVIDGYVCYSFHFTLGCDAAGQPALLIGCIQGARARESATAAGSGRLVAQLTECMHGSRPKNLLLFALRRLARNWSIPRILAVSSEHHVFRQNLRTDYNVFWREVQGSLQSDGMFELPIASSSLQDLPNVPPKRRPAYRRRCQLWDVLGEQIDHTLSEPSRPLETLQI